MKHRRFARAVAALSLLAASLTGMVAAAPQASATQPPIVVVFMENHSASDIIGNTDVPYLNSLVSAGTRFTNYTEGDSTGPSLPDYLEFASGSRCGSSSDTVTAGKFKSADGCPTTVWNQLETAGKTWGVYEDAMNGACSGDVTYQNTGLDTPYALKHNPATPFDSIWGNQTLCQAHVLPFSSLPGTLPAVSFITPGICNDQHGSNGSFTHCVKNTPAIMTRGDDWLQTNIDPLITSGADVFVTYDEDGTLYAVGVGPSFVAGATISTAVNHYGLLAGIEDAEGLSRLNNASGATPIVFSGVAAPTITSISPTHGKSGDHITITGTTFTGATAVSFNGTAATSFTVTNATHIDAVTPGGFTAATNVGPITVTTPGGSANSANFTADIPASVANSPTHACVAASVTISGSNFTGATNVKFNTTSQGTFTVVNDTTITTTVPAGASNGSTHVITPTGTGDSASSFTVDSCGSAPTVTSFDNNHGNPGQTVHIVGTNFTGTTSVTFNGTADSGFTVVDSTHITSHVPAGASTGLITVTNANGSGSSASNYTVISYSVIGQATGTSATNPNATTTAATATGDTVVALIGTTTGAQNTTARPSGFALTSEINGAMIDVCASCASIANSTNLSFTLNSATNWTLTLVDVKGLALNTVDRTNTYTSNSGTTTTMDSGCTGGAGCSTNTNLGSEIVLAQMYENGTATPTLCSPSCTGGTFVGLGTGSGFQTSASNVGSEVALFATTTQGSYEAFATVGTAVKMRGSVVALS